MIECIPNFSEGRRPEVIAAITEAIRAVDGAYVLDTHIDADHNRSVVTFAGQPSAVAEAAFRAVEAAALLIDLNQHQGQHPRIGATDVLPFVPLRGATMGQCIEIARAVGKRIATMLDIPVYLYANAARRTDRRELPDLRRGEFEGLREAILTDAARAPDYGPHRVGPAGATVVGAREPLIAYNLFLNTSDVAIAKRIARAVRGSSGGLRGVRALGMLVHGQAQVSMNLTDYRHTPVHRAVEMVAREAEHYGVGIARGELVGLMPEDALIAAGRVGLRLPELGDAQILERRLTQVMAESSELRAARPIRTRLAESRSNHNSQHERVDQATLESQMDALWWHSVHALAAAVNELASAGVTGRMRSMLLVLSRELLALVGEEQTGDIAERVQVLLLLARRAVKATEALAGYTADEEAITRAALVVHLAYSVAAAARLRAMGLLPLLDAPQRAGLAVEFAAYTQRARELLVRIDPVA